MTMTRIAKKIPIEAVKPPVKPARKVSDGQGVRDIITQTNPLWQVILKRLQKLGRTYGFLRVETPLVEEASLYDNYFKDESALLPITFQVSGKTMALRPALLPSVLRSYVQNRVGEEKPLSKWLYSGSVSAVDESGKIVSDFEFGVEVLGVFTHLTEAQCISSVWHLIQSLGLAEATLEINTMGNNACQSAYQEVLKGYLHDKKFELCDECNDKLEGRALQVLRCANLECQVAASEAPTILDYLDEEEQKRFTAILEALDELHIAYQLNPLYVGPRGATHTNFVIKYKQGSRSVVIGEGGYHDNLVKQVTGKAVTSFGFNGSLGLLEQVMAQADVQVGPEASCEVFLVPLGELASKKSLRLFHDLTTSDIRVYDHFGTIGVKNQLKAAEENKSPIALIMGQKEAIDEMVILRDVKSGMQEVFSYDKIVIEVKKRLGR